MSNINQAGVFRGMVLDRGLEISTNGFYRLHLILRAMEKYDDQNGVWIPWEYDEVDAQAYLTLDTSKGGLSRNVSQAMKAFGWDGVSFGGLQNDTNLAEQIQWRMDYGNGDYADRLGVVWIDHYEANPNRTLTKMDAAAIRALDAKYASALKSLGGGPKPVSAKPSAPKSGPTPPAATPTSPSGMVPSGKTEAGPTEVAPAPAPAPAPEKPRRGRRPGKPPVTEVPAAPAATPPEEVTATPSKSVDKATAWADVYSAGNAAGKSDKEITGAWIAACKESAIDDTVGESANWSPVKNRAINMLGV